MWPSKISLCLLNVTILDGKMLNATLKTQVLCPQRKVLMTCLQPVHAFELTIKPPKSLDLKLTESFKSSHLTSHLFLLLIN